MKRIIFLTLLILIDFQISAQQKIEINLKTNTNITPPSYGLFFEDINFSADGGLYAELVKNRSFEFDKPLMGWKELNKNTQNQVLIINRSLEKINNNRYAHIVFNNDKKTFQLMNEGFRGMGFQQNESYIFYITAKTKTPDISLKIDLLSADDQSLGSATLTKIGKDWKEYKVTVKSNANAEKGKLAISFVGNGSIDVDMVSLFPQNTWKNREKGLRRDLVEVLNELQPGFLRFPGGCIVEGRDLLNRYQWKNTIGDINDRRLEINRWNTEFSHRSAPDYFQSFGLGFYEYFLLSEDIGAAPLPILNCGMACQFNTGEVVAMNELEPYIQDALDLIEFANGDSNTKWGKLRTEMGHPASFNLTLLGVGNEQWDVQYIERYAAFEKVLKAKHPEVKLIAASGPSPDGERFEYAWQQLKNTKVDLLDEHYYQNPEWFFKNANRYDNYDRKGPKVFAGEYASHIKDVNPAEGKNSWLSALSEAAFITGLERNGDIVTMASYAPLMAHVNAWQWRPDLIWFDNLKAVKTANYFVQKMYALNRGDKVVDILINQKPLIGQDSLYASSTINQTAKKLFIKIVNTKSTAQQVLFKINGAKKLNLLTEQILTANNLNDFNGIDEPDKIKPLNNSIYKSVKSEFKKTLKPYSFTIYTIDF
ncbi:alpha-L-arabinofuranosidase C-terminal domain-containing protein [Pedobacter alpinus]|uniref:non-reducing end alpha-L-arabinofuranosidase n=1 Tax=Pedobacter alpinus TaxID=1590643 RepID=A0ABW5TV66_9SPHI